MNILPKTRDEWIAFPFYLLVHSEAVAQHVRYGTGALGMAVITGYMLSVVVLLIGALIQSIICRRGAATRTLLYVVAAIILVFSVYQF